MIVAIDLDGVLSQSCELIAQKLDGISIDDVERWIFRMPTHQEHRITEFYLENKESLRREYSVYSGAPAVLNLLSCELLIVTNRVAHGSKCAATNEWLTQNQIPSSRIIYTTSKKADVCLQESVSVIIEDNPNNALSCAQNGIRVLLFDKQYNRDVSHPLIERFTHWLEVPRLLRGLQ